MSREIIYGDHFAVYGDPITFQTHRFRIMNSTDWVKKYNIDSESNALYLSFDMMYQKFLALVYTPTQIQQYRKDGKKITLHALKKEKEYTSREDEKYRGRFEIFVLVYDGIERIQLQTEEKNPETKIVISEGIVDIEPGQAISFVSDHRLRLKDEYEESDPFMNQIIYISEIMKYPNLKGSAAQKLYGYLLENTWVNCLVFLEVELKRKGVQGLKKTYFERGFVPSWMCFEDSLEPRLAKLKKMAQLLDNEGKDGKLAYTQHVGEDNTEFHTKLLNYKTDNLQETKHILIYYPEILFYKPFAETQSEDENFKPFSGIASPGLYVGGFVEHGRPKRRLNHREFFKPGSRVIKGIRHRPTGIHNNSDDLDPDTNTHPAELILDPYSWSLDQISDHTQGEGGRAITPPARRKVGQHRAKSHNDTGEENDEAVFPRAQDRSKKQRKDPELDEEQGGGTDMSSRSRTDVDDDDHQTFEERRRALIENADDQGKMKKAIEVQESHYKKSYECMKENYKSEWKIIEVKYGTTTKDGVTSTSVHEYIIGFFNEGGVQKAITSWIRYYNLINHTYVFQRKAIMAMVKFHEEEERKNGPLNGWGKEKYSNLTALKTLYNNKEKWEDFKTTSKTRAYELRTVGKGLYEFSLV